MANNKKEQLPIDFITSFVSKGWEEVGNLQASIAGINQTFSGTQKVSKYLQDLVDAYLIALGLMEAYLDKKDYLDMPDTEELQEHLTEDLEVEIKPETDKVVLEIKTENNSNEVEQETTDSVPGITPPDTKPVEEPFEFFTTFEDPVIDLTSESPYQAWVSTHN